ncbi:TldD/PmbA family protein [Thiolapillus brandeum]|uniref:Modulator of DNA gyrase PmbA n=1 Tax=Thiolapillus brandeum TaxID=1076588 RepID=A0A7U6GGE1_9GAMM|nr:TldD/PmbA family protein [Thiolapillus brandeum]BAO43123.1 modulator of DNA gyrase PmbA [Thiolapillus brandeum]
MPDKMRIAAEKALELAHRAGARDAWASVSRSRDVTHEYRDGKLEKVKDATARKLSVQMYVDGRYASHSTTDLQERSLEGFIANAVALTRALQPDPYRRITPPELFQGRSNKDLELLDPAIRDLQAARRLAWCRELDEAVHGDKRLISASCAVYDGSRRSLGLSSNGFQGEQEGTSIWMGADLTYRDRGDRRASGSFYPGVRQLAALPSVPEIAGEALKRVQQRLGVTKGPSLKGYMVVDARAAGRLISSLTAPASARAFQQKQSFWRGQVGNRLFSEKLSLVDDPLLPGGLGSRLYDGEGIAARPLVLVDKGVVKNIYVDTYYGRKLKLAPTTGSRSNLLVKPGSRSLKELLAAAGEGVYVTSWLGGNADNTTGEFSLGLRGHMIRKGQVAEPVGEMNVTGNLRKLFASLVALGNDPWPYSSLRTPSMMFEGVNFSGA